MEFVVDKKIPKNIVTLSVKREFDGNGLVLVNGIDVVRFTKDGRIARIMQPTKIDKLKELGFKVNNSGQIEES